MHRALNFGWTGWYIFDILPPMKNFSCYARVVVFSIIGLWLLLNLVGWLCCGSYERVGIGLRLLGFLLWGAGLSLVPVVLAAPSVMADGTVKWRSPLSWIRLALLAVWGAVLIWFVEVPFNTPRQAGADAEVIVAAGVFWVIALAVGSLAVAMVLALLRWLAGMCCHRD